MVNRTLLHIKRQQRPYSNMKEAHIYDRKLLMKCDEIKINLNKPTDITVLSRLSEPKSKWFFYPLFLLLCEQMLLVHKSLN